VSLFRTVAAEELRQNPDLAITDESHPTELPEAVPIAATRPEPGSALAAKTVCVWGPAGSGKSTVALNLATELALIDKRVLLIDADSVAPALGLMLGITENPPGLTAALRLVRADRLDQEQWLRVSERIEFERTSFDFLAGLSSPRRWPELRANELVDLLAWVSKQYDYVVFDCASGLEAQLIDAEKLQPRNEISRHLVAKADITLAVCAADVIGVNRFLWQLRQLNPQSFTTVANRVRSAALGSNPNRQLADTLHHFAKITPHAYLPDDSSCDAALLAAKPLALQAKNSKLREALRLLALDLETL
jgi:MinD-like ATPase involved in chromosome partitioning or flagellar assembly